MSVRRKSGGVPDARCRERRRAVADGRDLEALRLEELCKAPAGRLVVLDEEDAGGSGFWFGNGGRIAAHSAA